MLVYLPNYRLGYRWNWRGRRKTKQCHWWTDSSIKRVRWTYSTRGNQGPNRGRNHQEDQESNRARNKANNQARNQANKQTRDQERNQAKKQGRNQQQNRCKKHSKQLWQIFTEEMQRRQQMEKLGLLDALAKNFL